MAKDLGAQLEDLQRKVDAVEKLEDKFKDSGFDWTLLIEKPEEKNISLFWLVSSIAGYLAACSAIIWLGDPGEKLYTFLFVVGLLTCIWVSISVHLKFGNATSTTLATVILLLGLSLSAGLATPEETIKDIRNQIEKSVE